MRIERGALPYAFLHAPILFLHVLILFLHALILFLHAPILFLHNGIFGKLEEELFGSHIAEVDCGFLIIATAFHVRHGATPKALVFYHRAYCQGMGS